MRTFFYAALSLCCTMFMYGCKNNRTNNSGNTNVKQNKMDTSKVKFYARGSGSNNGWKTYYEELAITNYHNKSMTMQQFYAIAVNYIDTVKLPLPVSAIAFLGQKPGETLPSASDDFYMDERKKLHIVVFGFDNAFKETASKKKPEIFDISIMHNGEYIDYPLPSTLLKGPGAAKSELDSLLNSTTPLDTGFSD